MGTLLACWPNLSQLAMAAVLRNRFSCVAHENKGKRGRPSKGIESSAVIAESIGAEETIVKRAAIVADASDEYARQVMAGGLSVEAAGALWLVAGDTRDDLAPYGQFKQWCADHHEEYQSVLDALSYAYGNNTKRVDRKVLSERQLSAPEPEPAAQTALKVCHTAMRLKGGSIWPARSLLPLRSKPSCRLRVRRQWRRLRHLPMS